VGAALKECISPVQKQTKKTTFLIGKNDDTKKFHVMLIVKHIEIPVPPDLKGRIEGMAFDFSCGIEVARISEICKEADRLIAQGYTEEQAPCGI
jgi:hypothetical protein